MIPPPQPPHDTGEQTPLLISEEMLARGEPAERIDFEQGISYFPGLVLVLIAVITAVFGWEMVHGALANKEAIIAAGAIAGLVLRPILLTRSPPPDAIAGWPS